MCGRATLTVPVEEIAEHFAVAEIELGPPRFNIAPSQDLVVVRGAERALSRMRWGLVAAPSRGVSANGAGRPSRTIQARAETVDRAPAYRISFHRRRCLVVVDGFFEWQDVVPQAAAIDERPPSRTRSARTVRRPHHVRRSDGRVFALAGIWDTATTADGAPVDTCAVLTTEAQGPLRAIHDRMPLVVAHHDYRGWLSSPDEARAIMKRVTEPYESFIIQPVSTWVNDVTHDDPRCLEPDGPSSPNDDDRDDRGRRSTKNRPEARKPDSAAVTSITSIVAPSRQLILPFD